MKRVQPVTIVFSLLCSVALMGDSSGVGCRLSIDTPEESHCEEQSPFENHTTSLLTNIETTSLPKKEPSQINKITPNLTRVELNYQDQPIKIERSNNPYQQQCPPYCIQPMQIEKVQTIGELEVLDYMQSLSQKSSSLLVDARTPSMYKKGTIPTAINLPYTLFESDTEHRDTVLNLLGATQRKQQWQFKNVRELFIFDSSQWDFKASNLINHLIQLGYPQDHMHYYRGGLINWKSAGLTLTDHSER